MIKGMCAAGDCGGRARRREKGGEGDGRAAGAGTGRGETNEWLEGKERAARKPAKTDLCFVFRKHCARERKSGKRNVGLRLNWNHAPSRSKGRGGPGVGEPTSDASRFVMICNNNAGVTGQ